MFRRVHEDLMTHCFPNHSASRPRAEPLAAPRLIHASDALGWDGFTVRTYNEPDVMEHWRAPDNPALTLVMLTQGVMCVEERRIGGPWRAYQIRQGEFFLRPPGRAPYELRWTVTSPEPAQTLHINVPRELVLRTATALGGEPARREIVERVGFQDSVLAQVGVQLEKALAKATPADALYAQTAVQFLVAHVLRHHVAAPTHAPERPFGLTHAQVEQVGAYVQARLHEPLTLDSLATVVGYSPYHFARLFRQATGDSPYQYVLRQRVTGAQRLLRETTLPVQQVALACGFANQSHFTRVFSRMVGITPGAYRRATTQDARQQYVGEAR
jgi:AraC family transcriptional regulator